MIYLFDSRLHPTCLPSFLKLLLSKLCLQLARHVSHLLCQHALSDLPPGFPQLLLGVVL